MRKHLRSVIGCLVALCAAAPAFAQAVTYHYSSGGSRVVDQSRTGYSHPEGTYIIPGATLSPSAYGVQTGGAQSNAGLPRVNMGSWLGTPGDNQYSGNRVISTTPVQQYQQQVQVIGQQQREVVQRGEKTMIIQGSGLQAPPTGGFNGLPRAGWGSNVGTPGDMMRSDLHPGLSHEAKVLYSVPQASNQSAAPQYTYHQGDSTPAIYDGVKKNNF